MGIFVSTGKPPEFQVDVSINAWRRRDVFESFFMELVQHVEAAIDKAINTVAEKGMPPVCQIYILAPTKANIIRVRSDSVEADVTCPT
jgi:hypothetical protein